MVDIEFRASLRGALFRGDALRTLLRSFDAIAEEVGAQGLAEVQTNLDQSIRNPTPYYETQIMMERAGRDRIIHDRGVIYGPWLEGTGSRNRTTRFRGYASFRRARQATEQKAGRIARVVLRRFIPGMN